MASSPLKIAISGFSGTGKTTLVRAISERFELPVIEEDMRAIGDADVRFERARAQRQSEALPALKGELIESFLRWDRQRTETYAAKEAFVADRCEVDLLDWWLVRFGKGRHDVDALTGQLLGSFQKKMPQFDLVVITALAPVFSSAPNEQGNGRKVDFTTHLLSHTLMTGLIQNFTRTPMLVLPREARSTDERIDCVSAAIEKIRAPAGP